ncbi:unnamed protein product [Dracunculus medinensis]|uniref:Protein SMG9 n=1 Tax=Dracunculus medinensis TaxID=318479 RepID=A0A0N4UQU3_DRAME|nr:unnamed protein product [Dracunculus medinensis]
MDENNEKKKKKWRSYRANISANIDTNSSSQNAGQEFSSPSILIKTGRFRDKSASDNVGAPEKDSVVTIIPRPTALLSKPKDTSSICEDSSNSKNFASVQDSEGTDPPQGANQKAASLVQRKISKANKSNPQNAPVPAEEEAEYESLLPMSLAIRLIGDHLEFMDYVLNHLSNTNTQFTVIGAIGPQGCGKSTLLSMLTGNNSQDLYR